MASTKNKQKIINDPVYGFVKLPFDFIYDVLQHRYFQRLREIKQLGLTSMVYPGAMHNRFQHAIGAMHLMSLAVSSLTEKGVKISTKEAEAVHLAILLHDIGHGPFSHALEHSIVKNVSHESISLLFMLELNKEFNGKLDLAIQIYQNNYKKRFLHQLVSSQLDMDRLDYLRRDSFFTGVSEGTIGSDRIIKMLNVKDDELVVEAKGIYSIEKFLIARRLMYWQVYLHKTAISAERMLVNILKRARQLCQQGIKIQGSPPLIFFLENELNLNNFRDNKELLHKFAMLDDSDIMQAIKLWSNYDDIILSSLSKMLIERNLFKISLQNEGFSDRKINKLRIEVKNQFKSKHGYDLNDNEVDYFLIRDTVSNSTYTKNDSDNINILFSNGKVKDISKASDILNLSVLSKNVTKNLLAYADLCL